jgi:geranyl-CoA carboxylase beta subunit
MQVIESQIDPRSEEFVKSRAAMEAYVAKVRAVEHKQLETELGYRPRAQAANKLLPRERLARLLDPGAPFFELSSIAGHGMYDDSDGSFSGGKLIAGIGYVARRRCLVVVWNYAIKGGTIDSVNVRKMLRVQRIAFDQKLPIVSLHESGGGNLAQSSATMDPWAAALFVEGGQIYGQQAELSAAGIPQITVSHGNATAGGAYQVALSDYIVLVRGKTQLFLAGPPLLKAGTGEEADAESLGGAEMHATVSGTGEYLAENDADAIRVARTIVSQLPADPAVARAPVEPPLYDTDELIGIFPDDRRRPMRAQEVIARIVDGSRFDEFNPSLDAATVCGIALVGGKQVGILSNNGPITPAGANKASQFIQLCDQKHTPLLFLQNTTGFLVGTQVERAGQVKHSAKLIQQVANCKNPKITVLVGNSYGAGNYAMASRALKPDFVVSWPSARQALMGGAQGAKVMQIVTEQQWARKGIEPDDAMRAKMMGQTQMIQMGLEVISESMFCSARLMDDGIIDPRDTRRVVDFLLETCLEGRARRPQPLSYGVQRL